MTARKETSQGIAAMLPFSVLGGDKGLAANAGTFLDACAKAGMAWQQGCARFIAARLEADVQAAAAVAACKTPQELLKLQGDWVAGALNDYTSEVGRMMEVATDFASNASDASAAGADTPSETRNSRRSL